MRCLQLLAASANDEAIALKWFETLVEDSAPEVQVAAMEALARWGVGVERLQPRFIRWAGSENLTVRIAAVHALGATGDGPEVVKTLVAALAPEAAAPLRQAATDAFLNIDPTDAKQTAPILVSFLKSTDASVRYARWGRVASWGRRPSNFCRRPSSV